MNVTTETVAPRGAEDTLAGGVSSATVTTVEQLSWPTLLVLHIVPGALTTIGYVILAPVVEALGFPPIAALLASIVLVMVPIELGIIVRAGRGQRDRLAAIPYRRPLPRRTWLVLVPVLILAAFIGFGVHMAIEPALIDRLFGWLPAWFVTPIVMDAVGSYSMAAWALTIIGYFAINGFIGPIVEELYFRGYLLPRMERLGAWTALVNVALFSLYHFWSPWQFFARILGFGPTVYAVRATRNVYLGMAVHCTINTIGVTLVAVLVFSRL